MPMSNPPTTTPDAASHVVKVTMNKQNLLSIHVSHNDLFEILTLYGACPSVMAHFIMRFLFFFLGKKWHHFIVAEMHMYAKMPTRNVVLPHMQIPTWYLPGQKRRCKTK